MLGLDLASCVSRDSVSVGKLKILLSIFLHRVIAVLPSGCLSLRVCALSVQVSCPIPCGQKQAIARCTAVLTTLSITLRRVLGRSELFMVPIVNFASSVC